MRNRYAWEAKIISIGSRRWERDGSKIKRQDLLPEAKVWFDFVQRSQMPSRNTIHISIEVVVLIAHLMKRHEVFVYKIMAEQIKRVAQKNIKEFHPTRQQLHSYAWIRDAHT